METTNLGPSRGPLSRTRRWPSSKQAACMRLGEGCCDDVVILRLKEEHNCCCCDIARRFCRKMPGEGAPRNPEFSFFNTKSHLVYTQQRHPVRLQCSLRSLDLNLFSQKVVNSSKTRALPNFRRRRRNRIRLNTLRVTSGRPNLW